MLGDKIPLIFFWIYLFITHGVGASQDVCGDQWTICGNQSSPSTVWILGFELSNGLGSKLLYLLSHLTGSGDD